MAINYVRNIITSGYNLAKINDNFTKIETALQGAVSRDGTSPNQMNSDFDMNSNDILNAGSINTDILIVDGTPVQPVNLANALKISNALSELAPLGLDDDARTNLGLTPTVDKVASLGIFNSVAEAQTGIFAAPIIKIVVLGFASAGDCPIITYKSVSPVGGVEIDQFQSVDGRRWQLVDGEVDVRHVGIVLNNDTVAVANATKFQALIDRRKSVFIPGGNTYLGATIRLRQGTFIRGVTKNGVTWEDDDDGVLAQYPTQSRILFVGSYFTAFDSDPTTGLLHGAISDVSIMVGEDEQIEWLFDLRGVLGWTFSGIRMENSSPINAGGFRAVQDGANPNWLNRFIDVEIRIPDSSGNRTFSCPWTDSSITACAFTGGVGAYYFGSGNFSVVGGIFDRAKSTGAGWTVDKLTTSSTSIKFLGVDFDINNGYGLIISAANSPGGTFLGVIVEGCHFRAEAGALGDVIFVDHASTKQIGPIIVGNVFSVASAAPVTLNYAKWDANISNNQFPAGDPWTSVSSTVTSGSGTITTATGTIRYYREGRRMFIRATASITTNGTGAGFVKMTLPFAVIAGNSVLAGRENSIAGVAVLGVASGTTLDLYRYDNTYPGGNGASIVVEGVLELAA